MKYFGLTTTFIYLLTGIFLITSLYEYLEVPKFQVQVLGGIFIIYGIYRGIKVYQKYYKRNDDEI